MKQTTVEWLFKQLWEEPKDKMVWYAILDQAKKMEKEQIMEFAKLHVEAALKAKIEAMEKHMNDGYSLDEIDSFTYDAYPLDKIL